MYILMDLSTFPHYFSRFRQCEFLGIDENELDTSSLRARVVKSPTREILLSGRQSWTTSQSNTKANTATLLADFSRLAPSAARGFIPKDHVERTFRLINDNKKIESKPRRVVTPVGDLPFGCTTEVEQFLLPPSAVVFQAFVRERRIGEGLFLDQVFVVALDDIAATPQEEQVMRCYVEQYSYSELPSDRQPYTGLTLPLMQQYGLFKSFLERIRMRQSHVFLVSCYKHYDDKVETVIRFTGPSSHTY
ncbi:hypothetical protein EJ02DRAFT_446178 [Clathrospora elynae]|uniref:Uncharacterized protein n=1 Tax=Clathrospora elynae TaxID=706981 RepID=A0A6A5SQK9_9PLEO|nr:hypothetical protein EJ02DRAFT_446178 [Clathrospora elynae]